MDSEGRPSLEADRKDLDRLVAEIGAGGGESGNSQSGCGLRSV